MSWGVHGWMNATNSSQYCKTGDQIRVTSLPESNHINHSTRIKKWHEKFVHVHSNFSNKIQSFFSSLFTLIYSNLVPYYSES
jgi:hypothetical protein